MRLPLPRCLLLTCSGLCAAAAAQVVPDRTLHDPPRNVGGPRDFVINATAGRVVGPNLFHSFEKFDLAAGDSAEFRAQDAGAISNVLVRITGRSESRIDGTVSLDPATLSDADLYLINPFGIVIGPNAHLDVPGALIISTASYIKLTDGSTFDALRPSQSVLSAAAPAAFGFLGGPPGAIHIEGTSESASVRAGDARTLILSAGRIGVRNRALVAESGRIRLITQQSNAEVPLDADGDSAGRVELSGSRLAAISGGEITIRGNPIQLSDTELNVATDTTANGGGIDVASGGSVELTDSRLDANTTGDGDGGSVSLRGKDISIAGGRRGGDGIVAAIAASTGLATAGFPGSGRGGSIEVVCESLALTRGALITAQTGGNADGGNISVTASGPVTIDPQGASGATGLTVEAIRPQDGSLRTGNAGSIGLTASRLEIYSRGRLASSTATAGNAGDVVVDVGSLLIDGQDSPITTGVEARVGDAEVNTLATGAGGNIILRAGDVELRRGGVITATTFGLGRGGRLDAQAGEVRITGSAQSQFTGLFARSALPSEIQSSAGTPLGDGGDIHVRARSLTIDGPGEIRATADARATAGNVLAVIEQDVLLANGAMISVAAPNLSGGDITIRSGTMITLLDGSRIDATARLVGGNVFLEAPELVHVANSRINAFVGEGGLGGQIAIDPVFVVLSNSVIDGRSGGSPVRVTIDPTAILFSSNSQILSDAVTAPDPLDISGQLSDLTTATVSRSAVLQQACVQRYEGSLSSFVLGTRGGLPKEPAAWLTAFDLVPDASGR
jgi:filamentous hemagglutinin family protein